MGGPAPIRAESRGAIRRRARWLALPALAVLFLAATRVFDIPRPPLAACAAWVALAALLETLSVVGFILVFKLIFGAGMSKRQVVAPALRALGASSLLPGGVVAGPALAARSCRSKNAPFSELTEATVAFTVITLLPGAVVVGILGAALWLGLLPGPHDALLTLPAAGFTVAVLAALAVGGRPRAPRIRRRPAPKSAIAITIAAGIRAARDGVPSARSTLLARDWKLIGTVGYYAFDNAALWAAFHAYGATPKPTVIVMGYLVGSLGAAVPVPGGFGAVEGGLIGALVLYGAPAGPAAGAVLLYRAVSLLLPVGLGAPAWALLPIARVRRRLPAISASAIPHSMMPHRR
jgi:uncharacterized membrane protein YbhN (UPF0104 family)